MLKESHGRFTNIKIGSASETLGLGEHIYVIKYSMHDAIQPGENVDGESQFYWQLIPTGWLQDIDKATLTVHLPVASEDDVQCAVGLGETDGCEAEGAGTDTLTVTTGALDDHTPVIDQDRPRPAGARPGQGRALGRAVGPGRSAPAPVLLGIVVLLALLAGVARTGAGPDDLRAQPAVPAAVRAAGRDRSRPGGSTCSPRASTRRPTSPP